MQTAHAGEVVLDETAIEKGVQQVADLLNQHYEEAVVITVVLAAFFSPQIWSGSSRSM